MAYRPCHVADNFCDAPANLEGAYTKGTCYACGLAVCNKCSAVVKYLKYGRRRICHDCLAEEKGEEYVIDRMIRMSLR